MSWWKEAIGYQIYPKSFYGIDKSIGNIKGITQKLEYLNYLGIDFIWLCPIYSSPMIDNGYDVSDYYSFDKDFGSKEDVIELIDKAHKLGIKVIFDLIMNHTSNKHDSFIKSEKRDPYYDDFYIWLDDIPNWGSYFGGSAFKYSEIRNQYYMKVFAEEMPDLNWKSKGVRIEMKKVINYLLDLGIDGFRIDAISHLGKADFKSVEPYDKIVLCDEKFSNLPLVHEVLEELNREIFIPRNVMTVGEIGGPHTIDEALRYTQNELSMIFTFDHVWCKDYNQNKINYRKLKNALFSYQERNGWIGLYWMNHDQPRLISQYGDEKDIYHSGSMLAVTMYFLRGTPFIYNGEEIGMINYNFKLIEEFNDVSAINTYNVLKKENRLPIDYIEKLKNYSRDNARTIMQWNDEKYAGFSTVKPWFIVNENYREINVLKELQEEKSLLNEYKKIISLRKKHIKTFAYGSFKALDSNDKVIAYKRDKFIIISNMANEEIKFNLDFKYIILYSNYDEVSNVLKPYQALVLEEL